MNQPQDDELGIVRSIMEELYSRAGRSLPSYFPKRPLEQVYSPDSILWRRLLDETKQATVRKERDRLIVEFAPELRYHETREYVSALPQTIKQDLKGNVLTIESPGEFWKFLGNDGQRQKKTGLCNCGPSVSSWQVQGYGLFGD